jgi:predicted  nucleic acid-binding Zn-ribbon protein
MTTTVNQKRAALTRAMGDYDRLRNRLAKSMTEQRKVSDKLSKAHLRIAALQAEISKSEEKAKSAIRKKPATRKK